MSPPLLAPFGARQVTLHPGDVASGTLGDRFDTLLGSCVAVVMTDPRRTVGAMCHIVHARSGARSVPDSSFGDVALDLMYEQLRALGAMPQRCLAYVYGGGNMFPGLVTGEGHVGSANGRWVLEALAADGVTVMHTDLGGASYRRLRWTVGPGDPEVTAVAM